MADKDYGVKLFFVSLLGFPWFCGLKLMGREVENTQDKDLVLLVEKHNKGG